MGVRKVKRFSYYRHRKYGEEDIFSTLNRWTLLRIYPLQGEYLITAEGKHVHAYYREKHQNLWHGILSVRDWLQTFLTNIQGALCTMLDSQIGATVLQKNEGAERTFIEYTPRRNIPLVHEPDREQIQGVELTSLVDEWMDKVDTSGYQHSSKIKGPHSYGKIDKYFMERPHDVLDTELIMASVLSMLAVEDLPEPITTPISVHGMLERNHRAASSGQTNLNTEGGAALGKKTDMEVAVALSAMNPVLLDYTCSPKPEVVKTGKMLRYIIGCPMALILVGLYYFGGLIKRHSTIVDGCTIGMSRIEGQYLYPLIKQYMVCASQYARKGKDLLWEKYLDYKEGVPDPEGIVNELDNEMDCSDWEFTLNNTSAIGEVFMYLCCLDTRGKTQHERDIIANYLAHIFAFPLKLHDNVCLWVRNKMASGSLGTLYGNCKRHTFGYFMAANAIRRHGMRTRMENCGCPLCHHKVKDIKVDMDDLEQIVVGSCKLGDDDIAPNTKASAVFAEAFDACLGTVTVSEPKPAFMGAKFLQVQLKREGNEVLPYRETKRIWAKLLLMPRTPPSFKAAIQSAIFEAGANEELNRGLNEFLRQITPLVNDTEYRAELEKLMIKGNGACWTPVNVDGVLMAQVDTLKPMITIKRRMEKW